MKNKRRWTWKKEHCRKHSFRYWNNIKPPKEYHRNLVIKANRARHRKLEKTILLSNDYMEIDYGYDIDNAKSFWHWW